MDRVTKVLNKTSKKDYEKISGTLDKLYSGDHFGLDIKKLKGHSDYFRVRVGKYRIIYSVIDSEIELLDISKRTDVTYKKH